MKAAGILRDIVLACIGVCLMALGALHLMEEATCYLSRGAP